MKNYRNYEEKKVVDDEHL